MVFPARPSARCAPTERRRTPVTTRRRSMLRDSAKSWRPIAAADHRPERGFAQLGDVGDRLDAVRVQLLGGLRADAPQPAHRQRMQERQLAVGRHQQQAVGLGLLAGHLGEELGARDADGDRQPDLVTHPLAQPRADLHRRARHPAQPADVEERLVDRQRLDQREWCRGTPRTPRRWPASTPTSGAARRWRAGTAAGPGGRPSRCAPRRPWPRSSPRARRRRRRSPGRPRSAGSSRCSTDA